MLEQITKILAVEKLLDYFASGIGATAGPLFRPWQAYMEGHAKRISARADADALAIIAKAQADARQYLVEQDAEAHGTVEITHEHLKQLIEFQGLKRLANIRSVVESAAEELGDKEVADHEPDADWTARFFDCVQDVSSEHMQKLWAKVLSGEVENPGRTSLRTLDTLRNMTKREAELFEAIAGYVIGSEFVFWDSPFVERHDALQYDNLMHLEHCGLTTVVANLKTIVDWKDNTELVYSYQRDAIVITRRQNAGRQLKIPIVMLTGAGKELVRIIHSAMQMAYLEDFSTFLHRKGCQLSLIEGIETLPDGRLRYASRTPIVPSP